ncbi:MAG: hypothetical protein PUJ79_04095 [Helicobacter sp.]|nr:hypothetical protein [Helicobacter sp.]MDY5741160.1 hypothetical protein [Helicobacter sp.]
MPTLKYIFVFCTMILLTSCEDELVPPQQPTPKQEVPQSIPEQIPAPVQTPPPPPEPVTPPPEPETPPPAAQTPPAQPQEPPKEVVSFNPHKNPFTKGTQEWIAYNNNSYVRFYKSYFSKKALQECYATVPDVFLAKGEEPELIRIDSLDDARLRNFQESYLLMIMGGSAFSAAFIPNPEEALVLARVLRAKYVLLEEKLLDEYAIFQEQQIQLKRMEASFWIGGDREDPYNFTGCTKLNREFKYIKEDIR